MARTSSAEIITSEQLSSASLEAQGLLYANEIEDVSEDFFGSNGNDGKFSKATTDAERAVVLKEYYTLANEKSAPYSTALDIALSDGRTEWIRFDDYIEDTLKASNYTSPSETEYADFQKEIEIQEGLLKTDLADYLVVARAQNATLANTVNIQSNVNNTTSNVNLNNVAGGVATNSVSEVHSLNADVAGDLPTAVDNVDGVVANPEFAENVVTLTSSMESLKKNANTMMDNYENALENGRKDKSLTRKERKAFRKSLRTFKREQYKETFNADMVFLDVALKTGNPEQILKKAILLTWQSTRL